MLFSKFSLIFAPEILCLNTFKLTNHPRCEAIPSGFYNKKMEKLRFLQPNEIDAETLNDPAKLKAYFDWKYENFEEEYKEYRKEKRILLKDFLDTIPSDKKELYLKRYDEYFERFLAIDDKYFPILEKAMASENTPLFTKILDEEHAEKQKLDEEYNDIEFMLK